MGIMCSGGSLVQTSIAKAHPCRRSDFVVHFENIYFTVATAKNTLVYIL